VRGSLSTAPAITCVASFIVAEGTSPPCSHLGGRPSTPRWRLSSLALRPLRATRASNGGWGETSAASTSILWGRPHALAVPMNRSEYFECVLQEMSRGEKAPAASTPVRTLQMTARKRRHPQSALVAHRGSCWPVVLRRYPHDEAVTCIPWRAPLVAEAPSSLSSPHPCKHGRCASVDFEASDGHRPWSSFLWSPVTEDMGGRSRQ